LNEKDELLKAESSGIGSRGKKSAIEDEARPRPFGKVKKGTFLLGKGKIADAATGNGRFKRETRRNILSGNLVTSGKEGKRGMSSMNRVGPDR